jgi:hypothetical protein
MAAAESALPFHLFVTPHGATPNGIPDRNNA